MIAPLANSVSIAEVDRLLTSPVRPFPFPPAVEACFEQSTGAARSRYLAATGEVVTVSIGAAVVRPDDTETSAPGIAAADAAMYAAKQHQRNCVWPPLTKPA